MIQPVLIPLREFTWYAPSFMRKFLTTFLKKIINLVYSTILMLTIYLNFSEHPDLSFWLFSKFRGYSALISNSYKRGRDSSHQGNGGYPIIILLSTPPSYRTLCIRKSGFVFILISTLLKYSLKILYFHNFTSTFNYTN